MINWNELNWTLVRRCILDAFEIEERGSTLENEIFTGFIHFITCLYVFPVVPGQLSDAGYSKVSSIEATALASGVGCIISSYITNLPFVIAPPTSVSIYLAVSLQQGGMNRIQGDSAVILSGCALLIIGLFKPITSFVTRLIPDCIQASTAVGIGLITALAGAIELDLVVPGRFTIVQMGPITSAVVIAIIATMLIAWATHNHVKGAFLTGLLFGTFAWWWYEDHWPKTLCRIPNLTIDSEVAFDSKVISLLANLIFLYILTLSGIARSMSDMAALTSSDDSIPRGNWLFIMCGFATILSGFFSGPPILISPESAGGIKAGAKTGLSTLVCGLLFLGTIFFCPTYSAVPPAGTSPLLILVGMTLFMNTSRIKWNSAPDAIPAFFVLLLIPFTYSILTGVSFGYILYIGIGMVTNEEFYNMQRFGSIRLSYQTLMNLPHELWTNMQQQSEAIFLMQDDDNSKENYIDSEVPMNPTVQDDVSRRVEVESGGGSSSRQQSSAGVVARRGAITDRFSMDLSTSIKSIQA